MAPKDLDMLGAGYAENRYRTGNQRGAFSPNANRASAVRSSPNSRYTRDSNLGFNAAEAFGGTSDQMVGRIERGESHGQDYWKGVQGKFSSGGPGYVGAAHKSFDSNIEPGLESYYDQAFKDVSRGIDKRLAARGMHGSSEGARMVADAGTRLAAERAGREAQFALDRHRTNIQSAQAASADELGWTQGLGALAFGAGEEELGYRRFAVDSALAGQQSLMAQDAQNFGQAFALDQFGLEADQAGMQAAALAQAAREGRIRGGFRDNLALGNALAGGYGAMLMGDASAAGTAAGAVMGQATDNFNIDQANAEANYLRYLQALQMGSLFGSYGGYGG